MPERQQNNYHFVMIIAPVIAFFFILGITSLQLLQYTRAHAINAAPLTTMHGTLSPLLARSKFQGAANPRQRISLALGLRPRNESALNSYVSEITRPGSTSYHHFLTPARYTQMFSPQDITYSQINDFLRNSGFTVTHTYNHHLLISFSGTVEQAERAFHVSINTYTAPDGRTYYANTAEPQLPTKLIGEVSSINGLNNAASWQHAALSSNTQTQITEAPAGCPGHGKGYLTPDQIATAYNLKALHEAGLQGEGQSIALFELNNFDMNDIKAYADCFSHGHTSIETIRTGSSPIPSDFGGIEIEMDTELILSAAPELSTLKIYQAGNDQSSYLDEWAQIVQDAVPIVSTSWGACEASIDPGTLQQEHLLLQTAISQGQNIFAATGDTGSNGCLYQSNNVTMLPRLNASDPSTQPFVTAVGGTSLALNSLATYGRETAWNTAPVTAPRLPGGASGGGISQNWEMPPWQNAPGIHNNFTSGTPCNIPAGKFCRQTPDVALNSDPHNGYVIYCSIAYAGCNDAHPWVVVGGTSTATPLWAALTALASEMAQRTNNNSSLGFITPQLYQIARDPQQYTLCFHDITLGDNDYGHVNGGKYPASAGYDMATGLGSYNAYNLASALVKMARGTTTSSPPPIQKPK